MPPVGRLFCAHTNRLNGGFIFQTIKILKIN
nr:MAG TPA: hypothetical protein [Caudoviricetes sp.]